MKSVFIILLFAVASSQIQAQFSQTKLENRTIPTPTKRLASVETFNAQLPLFSSLSIQEKEILYYTNVARSQPKYFWDSIVQPILKTFPSLVGKNSQTLYKDLINTGILPMFSLHNSLIQAARFHSNDLASTGVFSHTSSNGKSFIDRMESFGVKNTYAAENISMGQQAILQSIVLLYLDIGIPDLGHRKTLLSTNYTLIGIGYATSKDGSFYITQDFSSAIQ